MNACINKSIIWKHNVMRYLKIFIIISCVTIFHKEILAQSHAPRYKDGYLVNECVIKNGKVITESYCYYEDTIKDSNEREYIGEWKDGKYHGQGILTYPNGQKIVGEFEDGIYKLGNLRNLWNGIRFWFYEIVE